jgi:hypothetical protein
VFSDMKITECVWKAHDGQKPDEEWLKIHNENGCFIKETSVFHLNNNRSSKGSVDQWIAAWESLAESCWFFIQFHKNHEKSLLRWNNKLFVV